MSIGPSGLGIEKGYRYCKKPSMGEVRAKLGRVIPYHLGSRHGCILPRRSRRKSYTATLECKQPANVLLLMKGSSAMFSFMTLCVALITCVDIKQNLGHVWFLKPHTLGKLKFLITCVDIK